MSAEDIATVLEAVGDSWPTALVVVAAIGAWLGSKALPHLKEIKEAVQDVKHEVHNNSGSSMRDAVDRIEEATENTAATLAAHIEDSDKWRAEIEELLTKGA